MEAVINEYVVVTICKSRESVVERNELWTEVFNIRFTRSRHFEGYFKIHDFQLFHNRYTNEAWGVGVGDEFPVC